MREREEKRRKRRRGRGEEDMKQLAWVTGGRGTIRPQDVAQGADRNIQIGSSGLDAV